MRRMQYHYTGKSGIARNDKVRISQLVHQKTNRVVHLGEKLVGATKAEAAQAMCFPTSSSIKKTNSLTNQIKNVHRKVVSGVHRKERSTNSSSFPHKKGKTSKRAMTRATSMHTLWSSVHLPYDRHRLPTLTHKNSQRERNTAGHGPLTTGPSPCSAASRICLSIFHNL